MSTEREESEYHEVSQMGIGTWRPPLLRRFNNPPMFTTMFSVTSFFLIVPYGVLLVILPTLERIFNLNSRQTGLILMFGDLSGILASAITTNWYSARKVRWIGIGIMIVVTGYCIPVLTTLFVEYPALETTPSKNTSSLEIFCGVESRDTDVEDWAIRNHYFYLFFLFGFFLSGFGANAPLTAGLTYLDEIFSQKSFAVALSALAVFSFLGYPFGLALGSKFLSWHVTLIMPEGMTENSPEFVGAWWLGIVLPSAIGFCLAFVVLLYPQQMPAAKKVLAEKIECGITTLKEKRIELFQSLHQVTKNTIPDFRRLLRSSALQYLVIGEVFFSLQAGFQGYEPKIYAKLFRLKETSVGFILGIFHSCGFILGIIIGALFVKRKDWNPKTLSFIVFVLSLVSVPFLFGVLLNCPLEKSPSMQISGCTTVCSCSTEFYEPVCDKTTDITYFSPCYAGCNRSLTHLDLEGRPVWVNCSCVASGKVHPGECGGSCSVTMAVSLALTTIQQVIQYAGFVSLNVVFQRIVCESDRTIAQGLRQSARKALGTVPSPLLFGALIDWYCLIWKESGDGKRGNCWVYDTHNLIFWLCWVQVGLRLLSSLFYFLCWSHYPVRRPSRLDTPLIADAEPSECYSSTATTSLVNNGRNMTI